MTLLVFCTSCSIVNPDYYGEHQIKTRYKNGSPRTEFRYRKDELAGEFHLYDSSGNVRLKKSHADADSNCSYFAKDTVRMDSADIKRLSEEMSPLVDSLDNKYRKRLYPRFTGKVEYWIWINQDGHVEHAICRRMNLARPAFIQGTIEYIEGWKFSPNLVGGGALIFQRMDFEPYSRRTGLSALVLGFAVVTAFFYLKNP